MVTGGSKSSVIAETADRGARKSKTSRSFITCRGVSREHFYYSLRMCGGCFSLAHLFKLGRLRSRGFGVMLGLNLGVRFSQFSALPSGVTDTSDAETF